MIHYWKAFFLVLMVGNAIALPFYSLLNFSFGKMPEDKWLGSVVLDIFFVALITGAIWLLRKKLPDGSVPYGKKAYRMVGVALFGLLAITGINEWLKTDAEVSFNASRAFLLGIGMLLGSIALERLSPWLRLR